MLCKILYSVRKVKGLFRKTQLNKKLQPLQNTLEEQRDSVTDKESYKHVAEN